eukprot:g4985.t1
MIDLTGIDREMIDLTGIDGEMIDLTGIDWDRRGRCERYNSDVGASLSCDSVSGQNNMHWVNGTKITSCSRNRCMPIESMDIWLNNSLIVVDSNRNESTRLFPGESVDVKCESGYAGAITSKLTCPLEALDMAEPVMEVVPQCLEILCETFSFHTSLTAGMIPMGSQPCQEGQVLSTVTTPMCTVQCKPGFLIGSPDQSGDVTCPRTTATPNSAPLVDLTCAAQCPGGKRADAAGTSCVDCSVWYLGEPSGSNCEIPVLGIFVAFFGAIFGVVGAFYVWRKCFALQKTIDYQKALVSNRDNEIRLMTDAWRISWEQIEIEKELARGGGGIVYKGKMSGTEVAVKKIFETVNVDLASQQEVRWMQRARHPRLVLFFGCGRAPDNNIFVCIEFMTKGDLLHLLEESRENGRPLPWDERMQYIVDIAEAMSYVHLDLRSIHRDLKSENVLLALENGILRCKVADFGLSRIVGGTSDSVEAKEKRVKRSTSSGSRRSRNLSTSSFSSTSPKSPIAPSEEQGEGAAATNRARVKSGSRHPSFSFSLKKRESVDQGSRSDVASANSSSVAVTMTPESCKPHFDVVLEHERAQMTAGKGTVAYMAPELLTKAALRSKNAPYSQAVDTFAFGVIVWEVCELKRAWGDEKWTANIIEAILSGARLQLPSSFTPPLTSPPVGLLELMRICWSQSPHERPTFDRILDALLSLVELGGLRPVAQQQALLASQRKRSLQAEYKLPSSDGPSLCESKVVVVKDEGEADGVVSVPAFDVSSAVPTSSDDSDGTKTSTKERYSHNGVATAFVHRRPNNKLTLCSNRPESEIGSIGRNRNSYSSLAALEFEGRPPKNNLTLHNGEMLFGCHSPDVIVDEGAVSAEASGESNETAY